MAHGKKTGGRDFEPGNPGGPGRPALPEDIKQARVLNKVELERVLNKYINHSFNELVAAMKDPNSTVLDLAVCKLLSEAIKKGDQNKLGFVFKYLDLEPAQKIKGELGLQTQLVDLIRELEGKK